VASDYCPACGVAYSDHMGLTGTCEALQVARFHHLRRMSHCALSWARCGTDRRAMRYRAFAQACQDEMIRINAVR
jgi:hypothetical protein